MIEVEQSPQALGFTKRPVLTLGSLVGEGDEIGESLMIAFVLMVSPKLLERVGQGTFAKEHQLIETLLLGGTLCEINLFRMFGQDDLPRGGPPAQYHRSVSDPLSSGKKPSSTGKSVDQS